MYAIYSWRECHYLKRTKIIIKLKIRIVDRVSCSKTWWSAVLIIMIFQWCAKLKPTKLLINKKRTSSAQLVPPPMGLKYSQYLPSYWSPQPYGSSEREQMMSPDCMARNKHHSRNRVSFSSLRSRWVGACNHRFMERSIFKSNFPGMRPPWDLPRPITRN